MATYSTSIKFKVARMGNGKSAGLAKGDAVFIPAEVFPNEKPPKGKKGWEGQLTSAITFHGFI